MSGDRGAPREVFPHFVGCGRSGTTLFRNIFDANSRLAMTHEAHFVGPMAKLRSRYESQGRFDTATFVADLYQDSNFVRQGLDRSAVSVALDESQPTNYAGAVRTVYTVYADGEGKELYGDKTPGSVIHIGLLGSLFPEAKFVHIIRDGRAVALSYLERPEWGPNNMAEAANHWKSRVNRGREAGRALGPERYLEARYEDMVDDPEGGTRRICEFLGLAFEEGMLRYHERGEQFIAATPDPGAFKNLARPVTGALRDWRTEIGDSDRRLFEAIAGDELVELGYESSVGSPSIATRMRVAAAGVAWQTKRIRSVLPRFGKRPAKRDQESG